MRPKLWKSHIVQRWLFFDWRYLYNTVILTLPEILQNHFFDEMESEQFMVNSSRGTGFPCKPNWTDGMGVLIKHFAISISRNVACCVKSLYYGCHFFAFWFLAKNKKWVFWVFLQTKNKTKTQTQKFWANFLEISQKKPKKVLTKCKNSLFLLAPKIFILSFSPSFFFIKNNISMNQEFNGNP